MRRTSISFIVVPFLLWNIKCTHKYCKHKICILPWSVRTDGWSLAPAQGLSVLMQNRSNIYHINLSLPTALCCYWNIHWQHTQGQSSFSLYFILQAKLFFTSSRGWWEQKSPLFLCLTVWWDPFNFFSLKKWPLALFTSFAESIPYLKQAYIRVTTILYIWSYFRRKPPCSAPVCLIKIGLLHYSVNTNFLY